MAMTTHEIMLAMRRHFPTPEWALLFEVGNSTGHSQNTRADAVAMSLWPSRGLELWGFEFKASRSDWKRELQSPKAEPVAKFCDRWYVVAADGVIQDKNEVPAGWGYFKATDGAIRIQREAPLREERAELSRSFLAAILRRASLEDEELLKLACDKAVAEARAQDKQLRLDTRASAGDKLAALQKQVDAFEESTGLRIYEFEGHGKALAKKVKLAEQLGLTEDSWHGMQHAIGTAEKLAKSLRELQNKMTSNREPLRLPDESQQRNANGNE